MSYLLGLLAAVLLGAGFVLQQGAAEQEPQRHFLRLRLLADLIRRPRWLAGLITMVAGQVLSAWVLAHLVLAQAEPLLASNLLSALLLARDGAAGQAPSPVAAGGWRPVPTVGGKPDRRRRATAVTGRFTPCPRHGYRRRHSP